MNCLACGSTQQIEIHHVKTRGSGGTDDSFNLINLCILCHRLSNKSWHVLGPKRFLEIYPHVWEHLKNQGWYFNGSKIRCKKYELV